MLKAARPHVQGSERGQMLLLFVVMFSVLFAFAAFAVDQGFWFGRRRIVQTGADVAARGGAIAFFGSVLSPCEEAAYTATQNGIDVSDPAGCNDGPTATNFSTHTQNGIEECVKAEVAANVRSLFAGTFGIFDIDIGAGATACAGGVRGVTARQVSTANNRQGPEGIPFVVADTPGVSRDCFTGNHLQPGVECVIWASMDSVEIGGAGNRHNRLIWDDDEDCDGNVDGSTSEIVNGIPSWTCREDAVPSDKIDVDYLDDVSGAGIDIGEVRSAIISRLGQATTCNSLEGGGPAQSFQNAFGRADGLDGVGAVPPPPFPGGAAPLNANYVQNDCYNNPRIVILPFTNESATSSADKDVDGFAVVYITGCYLSNTPLHGSPAAEVETNTCSGWPEPTDIPDSDDDDAGRDCQQQGPYVPSDFCRYEIRAVPIRLFITDGAVGGLLDMNDGASQNDFPLTIETVE